MQNEAVGQPGRTAPVTDQDLSVLIPDVGEPQASTVDRERYTLPVLPGAWSLSDEMIPVGNAESVGCHIL